jgi:hypothetical protein
MIETQNFRRLALSVKEAYILEPSLSDRIAKILSDFSGSISRMNSTCSRIRSLF